jgi:predicted dienelactone hydrolase
MMRSCAIAAFALGLAMPVALAEPAQDIATRTELHTIQTLTLSDKQFLAGDAEAKATTVSGQLRLPAATGRLPVVVLIHGSGGMGPNIEMWAREFNAIGVATFAIDGFTGRGLTQTSTNQALLGRLNFILDVYRGLDVLAKRPRVDSQRIALMGFSRGGQGRSTPASSASISCGTSRASSSRPISRSIRTAPRLSPATPTQLTGRSASLAAPWTTTIRSRCARPMWNGSRLLAAMCRSPNIRTRRTRSTIHLGL